MSYLPGRVLLFPRTVRLCDRALVDDLIQRHYLHRWPGVVMAVFALMRGNYPTGVIVFALPPRETCKRYSVQSAFELARMYVDDCEPRNTETWFMSKCIKLLRNKYPDVELLISYADPAVGHQGTVYRAASWIQDGRTDQERKSPRCDYMANGKRYSRRSHVPEGVTVERVPRTSKARFVFWMNGHEKRRKVA